MKFGAPYMVMWLWVIPALVLFYAFARRSRQKALRKFAEEPLLNEIAASVDGRKRKIKRFLVLAAAIFIVISLLRPQWGFQWQEVKRQGLDIIIALDTSKSMLAEDVLPNRLERAKLAIKDLIKKLHGDRMGLIVFSGRAFLQCPLTIDYDGFLLSLEDVDVDTIPVGGTSLSQAIYTACGSYEGGAKKHKILIIITDGEDLEGGIEAAIQKAKSDNVKIYCVGIGSTEGELVPIRDERGRMSFLKNKDGDVVKTRLVESSLQKVALGTGGMYVRATGAEFGLDLIYKEKLANLEKQEFKSRMEKKYNERFQIPLGIAIFLLFISPLIGDKRKENQDRSAKK